jgi:multiple sugar transport system permease protein
MKSQHTFSTTRRGVPPFIAGGYLLAVLYALTIIIPFYFVFVAAFKENAEIFGGSPLALPNNWSFAKFELAQERADMFGSMLRSLRIVVGAEGLTLLLGFPAAYAVARIRVWIARWVELLFAMAFLIPTFALILPVFLLSVDLDMLYDPLYLTVFYAASRLSLTVILLASHIRDIPFELEEAAMIDGANRLQVIYRVILPLTQSGIATVLVLNFIHFWNEYLFALILLPGNHRTLQLSLPLLRSERLVDYGLVAAGVVIAVVPLYLLFMSFQERIVTGMLSGSVKA